MYYDLEYIETLRDEELIQLVQNHNEAAFSELMSRYTPRIWRVIITNSRQRRDAEEILTDIWMAVWNNISTLKKVDSFGPWLQKIAYNACNRYYASAKSAGSEIPHLDTELVGHIDEAAMPRFRENELRAEARETVQNLPERLRSVAILYYLESWRMKEIAKELDLPIGTVKTKLRETRSLLREEFDVEPEKGGIMSSEFVQDQNDKDVSNRADIVPATTQYKEPALWGLPDNAVSRFGRGAIKAMALSPNGKYLVLGTEMGLWWYEVETLSPITLWTNKCHRISAIAFSPSGEWIATGHQGGSVKVWDVQQGNCLIEVERQALKLQKTINALTFSQNGKCLAANGSFDYVVDVWNPETGAQVAKFGDADIRFQGCWQKHPLAISPDSRLLACADVPDDAKRLKDGYWTIAPDRDVISVWDISTGKRIAHLTDYKHFLHSLTFSPCGKYLVATDEGGEVSTLTQWDTENWEVQTTEQPSESDQLIPTYSTGEKLWVASVSEVDFTLWDTNQHKKYDINHENIENTNRRWTFDGTQLALATTHKLDMWNVANRFEHKSSNNFHYDYPMSLVFSADSKTLAVEYPFPEGTFRCWNVDQPSEPPRVFKFPGVKHCVYASATGEFYAVSVDGDFIKVQEFDNDTPIVECEIQERPLYKALAFSNKAQLLAYGDSKKNIHIWDITREEIIHTLIGHETNAAFLEFSPNEKYIASNPEYGNYRLWDIESGKELHEFHSNNDIEHIAFSPAGDVIAGETEKEFILWNIKSSETQLTIPKPDEHTYWWQGGIVFSPCGQYLATGMVWLEETTGTPIKVWNTITGENVATFSGHQTNIFSLAISPDGTLLASGSYDGSILLWNMTPYTISG